MDIYETENGYQVDCARGSFVFARSRMTPGNVELREVYPETARADAVAVLAEARIAFPGLL
jgi:hypothetical protein